ncbi:cytochrome c oxidase subunit 2A [Lentibacillus cibarius]|uniref:Cytochrome c oxidase subunit 2A n=1 Tax=Lentibacillus cibarius TaxID=2583219 RepID=A0A549YKY0_9BACI|nr:cytochrome c oxidase subunit 2A [Lentibacillus cibarius]TRM12535.1 cytochrome c oxidase subunit 2A [Lentibacillus cibarius]
MGSLQQKNERSSEKDQSPNLKGTFISVMLLGVFIIVSWVGVYIFYMMR